MQHLIFPDRLASDDSSSSPDEPAAPRSQDLADSIASLPPHLLSLFNDLPKHPPSARTDPDAAFDLHTLLEILDAPMAQRWHWRDTRKILRNLCIIKEYGRRPSEIIDNQSKRTTINMPRFGVLLILADLLILNNTRRFRTLFFWIYAEPSVLNIRLDERIDAMIEV
jgi:tRNA dimethylallyltransferase